MVKRSRLLVAGSGILMAFFGTALAHGNLQGLALLIAFLTLLHKIQIEERVLQKRFGDEFLQYARRAKALIPFVL